MVLTFRIVPQTCYCKELSCGNKGKPLSADQKLVPNTLGNQTRLDYSGFSKGLVQYLIAHNKSKGRTKRREHAENC